MMYHWLKRRSKLRRIVSQVLFALFLLSPLMCATTAMRSQESGRSQTVPPTNPGNTGGLPSTQTPKPTLAPNAAPWPFVRLLAVLSSGLLISAARLAHKFRRFWGLGVFANPYSFLFLIFGVGLCGIPAMSESALSSLPHLGSLGPWIADLSGIVATLVLPAIGFKPQPRPEAESQVRDLGATSSSDPVLALIEDAIRDRILVHIQTEIVLASRLYDWNTIRLAARRAIEEEMVIGRLAREDGDAALQSVRTFEANADSRQDSNDKYTVLLRLQHWCPFSHLRDGLAAAASETQP